MSRLSAVICLGSLVAVKDAEVICIDEVKELRVIAALVAVLGEVVLEPLGGAFIVAEVGSHVAPAVGVSHSYREIAGVVLVRRAIGIDQAGGVVVSADLAVISLDLHSVLITLGDDLTVGDPLTPFVDVVAVRGSSAGISVAIVVKIIASRLSVSFIDPVPSGEAVIISGIVEAAAVHVYEFSGESGSCHHN